MMRYLKCKDCGHECKKPDEPCLGITADCSFDYVCFECRGTMYEFEKEEGHHTCEFDKVLDYFEPGVPRQ